MFEGLKNLFRKKRKNIYMHLDEDLIKNNEIIKAQQQKIMAQESQLAKIYAEKKSKDEKIDEKKKENEFNKKLKEQKEDLDAHRHGKIIRLSKFYKHFLNDRNFRNSIEVRDKNNETVLAQFGDFGIMSGGKFCILDKDNNLMSYGPTLKHVLYKPDSFENMARDKKFLIPMDKDGNWMEDIEYKEINEPLDDGVFDPETGRIVRIKWSKVKTGVVKDIIANKMEQIHMLQEDLEMQEGVNAKLKAKIDDLNRALRTSHVEVDTIQTDLSKNLNIFLEAQKRFGDLHMQNTKLIELKATYENLIDKKDEMIEKVIAKLDRYTEPRYQSIKDDIHRDLALYKKILPSKVEITEKEEKEPMPITQPGEIIRRWKVRIIF